MMAVTVRGISHHPLAVSQLAAMKVHLAQLLTQHVGPVVQVPWLCPSVSHCRGLSGSLRGSLTPALQLQRPLSLLLLLPAEAKRHLLLAGAAIRGGLSSLMKMTMMSSSSSRPARHSASKGLCTAWHLPHKQLHQQGTQQQQQLLRQQGNLHKQSLQLLSQRDLEGGQQEHCWRQHSQEQL
jgi:hypothetical protein